jgi:preprotein translocase subunit SecY
MASAAEQLVAHLNFSALAKAEELRKRIWFTLGALLVYRLGTHIPLPGIDPAVWQQIFRAQAGGILGMFNMFAGGSIQRMAIFALSIMPYVSASIIMQLMSTVSSQLAQLKKEGESGRKTMNQYTRRLTVALCLVQAYGIAIGLESAVDVINPGWFFRLSTAITLTGGTMLMLWLGEQISARGVGNGISLIIMSGIVAELPSAIVATLELGRQGALSTFLIIGIMPMAVAVIAFIVFLERAQRRLLVQYPKRHLGDRMLEEGQSSYLPLKLNTAGVIPPIFASSLLLLPTTVASFNAGRGLEWFTTLTTMLGQGRPLFLIIYVSLIIFFAFFYTAIVFNPAETAESLKKQGGFLPGIRPGEQTAKYIDYVLTRITVIGTMYLALVVLLPELLIAYAAVPFIVGGTSLLIVVSVTMDTVAQIQSHLLAHQYEGLIERARLRRRNP